MPTKRTSIQTAIKYIGISLVVCVILLFIYANNVSFFDFESGSSERNSFHVSFLASAVEDLIFFMVIGVGLFVFSIRHPEDENLETRIGYLFSGSNATTDARQHALDVISKHACISPKSEMTITIEALDPDTSAFKVMTEWKFVLANMYKDQPYIDNSVPLELVMDDIQVPDGIYGQVQAISTTASNLLHTENFIDSPLSIKTLEFKKDIPLQIEPDGKVRYYVRFWHYSQLDGEYVLGVNRYTKELKIDLVNASGDALFFNIAQDPQQPRQVLANGKSVEIYKDIAKPEDNGVILYLHKHDV